MLFSIYCFNKSAIQDQKMEPLEKKQRDSPPISTCELNGHLEGKYWVWNDLPKETCRNLDGTWPAHRGYDGMAPIGFRLCSFCNFHPCGCHIVSEFTILQYDAKNHLKCDRCDFYPAEYKCKNGDNICCNCHHQLTKNK